MNYRKSENNRTDKRKSLDRGPREFETHLADKEGEVMEVAEDELVFTTPTNSIKNVAQLMKENDYRRIPVLNAGTHRLEGMAIAIDILDFLGGGEKYNIIQEDYGGNFLKAINCPIHKIMKEEHPKVKKTDSIEDVIDIMLEKRTSAIPVMDKDNETIAIVTERDILPIADSFDTTIREAMQDKVITSTPGMMISDVSKVMVRNRFRRLPIISEHKLKGVVTVFDVLQFLGYGEFDSKLQNADEVLSKTRVSNIMEEEVVTVKPDQDLAEVPKLVKETGLGGFPVIEDNKLVGIVTISDAINSIYS